MNGIKTVLTPIYRWMSIVLLVAVTGCTALVQPVATSTTTAPVVSATATAAPAVVTQPSSITKPTAGPTAPAPVGVASERSIGDPYSPELGNTGYDVQYYTLRVALDPSVISIDAHVTIEALSTLANLGQISLDFIGFDISAVTVNGAAVDYGRETDKLIVNFAKPLDLGEAFTLDVKYSGAPIFEQSPYAPFADHIGLFFNTETRYAFALSEPDGSRYWFPCNDHPRDKAQYRFELTVPEGLVGVANGTLVETHTEVPNALASGAAGDQYIWEHNYPMATYLATIAVGDYVRVDSTSPNGVKIRSYVYPSQKAEYEAMTPQIGTVLDWMSNRFGAYPFEEFGYVSIEGAGASLEAQTMVLLSSYDMVTMVHEMAHMWFGDWVSLDSWADIWRNEGFATYISAWALGGADQMVANWTDVINASPNGYPLNDPPKSEMFGRDSYLKGALLVDALKKEMGEADFVKALQNYFVKYGGGVATFDQFKAELEDASGQSLTPVFDEWFAPAAVTTMQQSAPNLTLEPRMLSFAGANSQPRRSVTPAR